MKTGIRPRQQKRRSTDSTRAPAFASRLPLAELLAKGKALRDRCPRQSHAVWEPPQDRPDPIQLVKKANKGRIPQLIPIRHERMLQSPYTYYRGTALNMAADLAATPTTNVRVQACGDAHLGNFRCFATPERRVIFDIHDLDETLPAPWEWDVKRLAASFVVACRNNGLSDKSARDAVLTCVSSYRENMAEFSKMKALDVWYASFEAETLLAKINDAEIRNRARKGLARAKERNTAEYDFPKLVDISGGSPTIRDNPPTIYHWHDHGHREFHAVIRDAFTQYRSTLPDDRRVLLDRYEFKDITIKVVGVGSVGTMCGVMLLMAGEKDPLFLQVKEASASVLEAYAGKSIYSNHGQRVVSGHRLMQSASDLFLGWTVGPRSGKHFYIRQLKDVKIKFQIEQFGSAEMVQFAEWCGSTLARAHARSGDPAVISGYLGKSDVFDKAIAAFSVAYADQTERDYETLTSAARKGKLEVLVEQD
jgi:uncharacterized protein (DUF2252 family)